MELHDSSAIASSILCSNWRPPSFNHIAHTVQAVKEMQQLTEASEDWEMSSHTTAGDVGIKV